MNADERVLSATPLPPAVDAPLRAAIAAYHDTPRAEQLLWRAQAQDPDCLYVYYALYKFYFSKGRNPTKPRRRGGSTFAAPP